MEGTGESGRTSLSDPLGRKLPVDEEERTRSPTRGGERCTGSLDASRSRERGRELSGEPVLCFFSTEEALGDLLSVLPGDFLPAREEVPVLDPCLAPNGERAGG